MIKVMLKKPVTSGYDQSKQLVDKLGLFLLVRGSIDDKFFHELKGEGVRWWKGMNASGNPILIPIDNIAYIEEVPGDVAG